MYSPQAAMTLIKLGDVNAAIALYGNAHRLLPLTVRLSPCELDYSPPWHMSGLGLNPTPSSRVTAVPALSPETTHPSRPHLQRTLCLYRPDVEAVETR